MFRSIRLAAKPSPRTPHAVVIAAWKPAPTKPAKANPAAALPAGYEKLDQLCGGALSQAIARSEFSAERGAINPVYPAPPAGSRTTKPNAPERIFILGLGDAATFTNEALRIAAARLVKALLKAKTQRVQLDLAPAIADRLAPDAVGRAVAEGLAIGNFEYDAFKGRATDNSDNTKPKPIDLTIDAPKDTAPGLKWGLAVGEAQNTARTLAATPPNVANPAYLVTQCRALARKAGLKCTIIDARQARRLNMQGLLSVGAAGSAPPALICLEHLPPGKKTRPAKPGPVVLVGKAVTFDTGGYSLKPTTSMEGMKYDKCGGMAVIGALLAAASLRLPTHVVGVIPTAENMVDEKAYRPGDILTMHNGVTVEVTNTDAEGRLILADALAYAAKQYRPRLVIDLATLTGGVVVALGSYCAGLFCNDPPLRDALIQAGEHTGEKLWQLPLWAEHRQMLKATHSDIVNSGGREAHPIQGAAFLSYFVDEQSPTALPKLPWAHVDIAGVADVKAEKSPFYGPGPTGFGVRLLARFLEQNPRA